MRNSFHLHNNGTHLDGDRQVKPTELCEADYNSPEIIDDGNDEL